MNAGVAAVASATVPLALVMFPGFVAGYLGGFSLDCRGSSPGIGAAVASAVFYAVFFAPVTIPATLIGAAIGWIGVRRKVPGWPKNIATLSLIGMLLGASIAVVVALVASPYPVDPSASSRGLSFRQWSELISVGIAGGGLLGLLVCFVVVLRNRRPKADDTIADPGA